MQIEINPKFVEENDPIRVPGGSMIIVTPPIDRDYWIYRVQLKHEQAIVAFPKFGTIGCGFAIEEDWNTNLPLLSCSPERLFDHIKHNKGFKDISDADCISAIKALQEFHKSRSQPQSRREPGEN